MTSDTPNGGAIEALNRSFAAIAGWSFDHRWVVVAGTAAIVVAGLGLASLARIDNSYEAYFDPDDPTYHAYEQFRHDFGSDEVSYILYDAPGAEHGAWDLEVMRRIARLTRALERQVPFIYEVTSLANAEVLIGVPDGVDVRKLADDFPRTQAELLAARATYLAQPMLLGGIASADGRHGAIVIRMDRSSTDPLEEIQLDPEGGTGIENLYPQVTESAIAEILARPEYGGIHFYHSGDVPLNAAYNRIIGAESGLLLGISCAVIGVLLGVFFRSFVSVVGPLLVVQVSVVLCVAFIGVVGWKLDMSFGMVPTLLTALGVAHSVHILSEFRARFAATGDRREALVSALYLVGTPCLLTSVTTAAGFLAMALVPILSISHLAVYGAFGVLVAFVFSLTLLMALLSFGGLGPPRSAPAHTPHAHRLRAALRALAEFDARNSRAILIGFAALFAFSGVGIARLVVDSNWLDDFSSDVPLVGVTEHIDAVMGGVSNLVYLFDAREPEAIKDPAVLREIDRLQQAAEAGGGIVRKTYSIVDIVKDLNRAFHGGDPAHHTLPETREHVAQYLLLYEMSGGENVEEYVSTDFSRASLELRLALGSTNEIAEVARALEPQRAATRAADVSLTGIGALWLQLLDYLVSSQIQGFAIAFGAVAAMLCLAFRSVWTGLLAMVPNLSPVLLTLGAMGWTGIPLDYNKVMIAAVALGIAVDDTIHVILRSHHEFRRCGDYREAIGAALTGVGRALVITSTALVLGFLCFTFSVMNSNVTFGVLLATTITMALVADFLLLPALLLTFHPFGPEGSRSSGRAPLREAA